MGKVWYSIRLAQASDLVIIDGAITKDRFEHGELKDYDTILVQNGDKVSLFCNEQTLERYTNEIEILKEINKTHEFLNNITLICDGRKVI